MSRAANPNSNAGLMQSIAPGDFFVAVTASDTAKLATGRSRIYVGTGGNIALVNKDGTAVTFSNVPDGTWLPVLTDQVRSTNTTASDIVALAVR